MLYLNKFIRLHAGFSRAFRSHHWTPAGTYGMLVCVFDHNDFADKAQLKTFIRTLALKHSVPKSQIEGELYNLNALTNPCTFDCIRYVSVLFLNDTRYLIHSRIYHIDIL